MRVDLSKPFEPIRKTVSHPSFGSCVLLLKPPGIEEMAAIDAAEVQRYFDAGDRTEALEARYVARARQCIVGWEGVEDTDGKPIAYSWPTLVRIGTVLPRFADAVSAEVTRVCSGISEEEVKNSDSPLPDTSAAAETITQS